MIDTAYYTLIAWLLNNLYAISALVITGLALWLVQRFAGGRVKIATELYKANIAVAIVVAATILGVCFVVGSANGTTRYDHHFKKYGHRFFARAVDWRWFKAQAIAESGLNPNIASPKGAKGLMQIMDATGREMAEKLSLPWYPYSPFVSIMAGIAYDRQLWSLWHDYRTHKERLKMMFASYNAGPGNINRARKRAICQLTWGCVMLSLPEITGGCATETITYVRRVGHIYRRIRR